MLIKNQKIIYFFNQSLYALVKQAKQIENIDVRECANVTDHGLTALNKECLRVKRRRLFGIDLAKALVKTASGKTKCINIKY